jgi:hypothetical protein
VDAQTVAAELFQKKKKKKKKKICASTDGGWSCAAKLVQSYQTLAKASS